MVLPPVRPDHQVRADADFSAQPVFAAVGETCGGVDHDAGAIDAFGEGVGGAEGFGEDGVGVVAAIVVDVSDGGFEGGVIAPGIHLSMEALHAAAAKLPRVALQKPQRVVGDDTVSAMQSGIFWGHVALIEGMIARIKAERNEAMTVVATGGVASLFHDATKAIDHFDPDLTIRGLLEIYRRNAGLR